VSESSDLSARDVIARYPGLRDDHLRYLEKWGLVRPSVRTGAGRSYGFADLAVIRQTASALEEGRPFRAVVRQLEAERHGQLAFDFRLDASPARVIALAPRTARPAAPTGDASIAQDQISRAERLFLEASALDAGDEGARHQAERLYRQALVADPCLVAALINLGNLHYIQGHLPEALALYGQAAAQAPDYFEAHYNLANALHDAGRFAEAAEAYQASLAVDETHAEAHFYLAVTFEKLGNSTDARPHWQAYRTLAPNGAWAELAKEFTENT
jgi:tetratricopeptide (TPR) repeat protein